MTDHPARTEIERLAYDALEGEERDRIRSHVAACPACRTAEQAFLKERETLSGALRPEPLPDSARRAPRRAISGGKMRTRPYWIAALAAAAAISGLTVVLRSGEGTTPDVAGGGGGASSGLISFLKMLWCPGMN